MLINFQLFIPLQSQNNSSNKEETIWNRCFNIFDKIISFAQKMLKIVQHYIPLDIIIIGIIALIHFKLIGIGILTSIVYMLILVLCLFYMKNLEWYQNIVLEMRNTKIIFPFRDFILLNLNNLIKACIVIIYIYIISIVDIILTLIFSIFFWLFLILFIILIIIYVIQKLMILYKNTA